MKRVWIAGIVAFGWAAPALAQEAATAIIVPPGGASDFCYYNGLAYSQNAVLTIDITNRRESPQSTQKAMLICTAEDGTDRLVWSRVPGE